MSDIKFTQAKLSFPQRSLSGAIDSTQPNDNLYRTLQNYFGAAIDVVLSEHGWRSLT
ncbi:hypothetical protein H6F67_01795 [Microcoleus sp. FACHB-1515]|uniref:hypothetical protein n=1 Tax=Cyanophyceae TaxID=3028117 RepID=UPI00168A13C8|nr:hypothetical protein [Microcoleus sp. FACHB-1515]MBD2088594.1 hypothetical protein [Microcoleus sp. FACHB-1515]